MLPAVDHPAWSQFVTGKKPVQSSKATLNLLVQRNKMRYEKDPSPANVKELVRMTHNFFIQYESLFAVEIAQILG